MASEVLDVRPLDRCGASIDGIDVTCATDDQIDAIRTAIFQRGVVFIQGRVLAPEEQIAFARRLAPIVINRYFPKAERYPEIAKVEKSESQRTNIGGAWHTDHSYDVAPSMGSVLMAVKTPPEGGDTLFADLYAAYDALSPGLKATLRTLKAHHVSAHAFGEGGHYAKSDRPELGGFKDTPEAVHPVVITHPGSGKPVLYVNPAFTTRFVGWTREESMALLSYLYQHATQDRFVRRFQWRAGSMAIWDNRCTWHHALNDYQGHHRLMHRITLEGGPLS
ncbi:TauD/TfdA family dioxygenase [uncultured Bradyrhizobium sp.]|uniref:TauD/TfdA dioxygenase family protein n=1 Tax=Bradyrhizobium sp. TaxID=376 RepID=UPI0026244C05|nr:TauD/TfdA family dioxygenase [uncultured Bradyrhizobium sp.]